MNSKVQHKIDEFKKLAASHKGTVTANPSNISRSNTRREDSLSSVIRSKQDADLFMAELESIGQRLK